MNYTKTFKDINKADVAIAGGKGASLGEMTQAGIQVPHGFVILAPAFDEFLRITDLNVELDAILDQVDHNVMHTVDDASEKIKSLILGKEMPQVMADEIVAAFEKLDATYVAVRSSATSEDSAAAAWAGQLDTYLNTTEKDMLENVNKCWASLFTPRAIFYRFERGLHGTPISVAVVVQEMIQSEVSGIAFSVHPVTQDYDQLIIEAGFGLGEAIVSGSITPDSYVVEKSTNTILDKNITIQEKGLYRRSKNKELRIKHDGEGAGADGVNEWRDIPEDEGGKPTLTDEQVLELAGLVQRIEKHYAFPVDVEWALEKGKFYIVQSRPITTLKGVSKEKEGKEWVFMWSSNLLMPSYWASPTALWQRNDVWSDMDLFSYYDGDFITTYMVKDQLNKSRERSRRFLDPQYFEKYRKKYRNEIRQWWRWIRRIETKDYVRVKREELLDDHRVFSEYQRDSIVYFGSTRSENTHAVERRLEAILEKSMASEWPRAFGVLATDTAYDSMQKEEVDWFRLNEGKLSDLNILNHVSKYPWLIVDLFDEKAVVEYMLDRAKETDDVTADEVKKRQGEKKAKLKQEQEDILKGLGSEETEARYLASFLQTQATERMNIKAYWAGSIYLARKMWEAIAEATDFTIKDLLTHITPPEINQLLAGTYESDLKKELGKRRMGLALVHDKGEEVKILSGGEAEDVFKERVKPPAEDVKVVLGQTASLGKYTGRVRKVVAGDLEALRKSMEEFQEGEVLVTSMTQPNMMPVARRAGAIIADEGGITSHAAIISRELGVPCIVGCLQAMQVFENGDNVEVDADKGIVRVLNKKL